MRQLRTLAFLATSIVASACVIREGDHSVDDDDWMNDDDSTSVSSGSGLSSSEGGGGTGGAGGAGGSEFVCNDGTGEGQSPSVCEELPMSGETCEGGLEPLGVLACRRAFEIWEPGHAEDLAFCLSTLPATDACVDDWVLACVADMYGATCEDTYIADTCDYWGETCDDGTFEVDTCTADLVPFNDDGLDEMMNCMNETEGTCGEAYDICFEQVTNVE